MPECVYCTAALSSGSIGEAVPDVDCGRRAAGLVDSRVVRLEGHEAQPGLAPSVVGPREAFGGLRGGLPVPDAQRVGRVAEHVSVSGVCVAHVTADRRACAPVRSILRRRGGRGGCGGEAPPAGVGSGVGEDAAICGVGEVAGGGAVASAATAAGRHRQVTVAVATLDRFVLDHLGAVRTLLHGRSPRRRGRKGQGYPKPRPQPRAAGHVEGSGSMRSMGERIAVLVSGNGTNLQALLDDPCWGPASRSSSPIDPASRRCSVPRPMASRTRSSNPRVVRGPPVVRRGRGGRSAGSWGRRRGHRGLHAAARTARARRVRRTVAEHPSRAAAVVPRHARVFATPSPTA